MRTGWFLLWGTLALGQAPGQSAADQNLDRQEMTLVASAAGALSQNKPDLAVQFAWQALREYPRSAAALPILIRAEIARGGARAALQSYEQWVANRRLDDAYVLRTIAAAFLSESSRAPNTPDVRRIAVTALAGDGDPLVVLSLVESIRAQGPAAPGDTEILAALGQEDAIKQLIAALKGPAGATPLAKQRLMAALAATHSPLAVPPLVELLGDTNDDVKADAATALAQLDAVQAASKIRPLFAETMPFRVRFKAAGALLKLHDATGLGWLRSLEQSTEGQGQLMNTIPIEALEMTSVMPDETWKAAVRALTRDPYPLVRVRAAHLLAPFEPDTSRRAIEGLADDSNFAIREEAAKVFVFDLATDFATLRRYLRDSSALTRTRAAARILELAR